jgi:hypothetical protein
VTNYLEKSISFSINASAFVNSENLIFIGKIDNEQGSLWKAYLLHLDFEIQTSTIDDQHDFGYFDGSVICDQVNNLQFALTTNDETLWTMFNLRFNGNQLSVEKNLIIFDNKLYAPGLVEQKIYGFALNRNGDFEISEYNISDTQLTDKFTVKKSQDFSPLTVSY